MPNLLTELQRQRDDVLTRLAQAQLVIENLTARLASIDMALTDMTRDAPTAMTYGAVVVDTSGVSVIAAADVDAADIAASVTIAAAALAPAPVVAAVPKPAVI